VARLPLKRRDALLLTLVALDLILLNASYTGVFYLRYRRWINAYFLEHVAAPYLSLIVITNLLYFGAGRVLKTFRLPRRFRLSDVAPDQARVMAVTAIGSIVVIFLTRGLARTDASFSFSRPTLLSFWIAGLLFTTAGRVLFGRIQAFLFARGALVRRTLIVGTSAAAAELAERLRVNAWFGGAVAGVAIPASEARLAGAGAAGPAPEVYEDAAGLEALVAKHRADEVFAALRPEATAAVLELLEVCKRRHVALRMLPRDFQMTASHFMVSEVAFLEGANRYDILFELYGRVNREVSLEHARIAVVGSKGIPATFGGIERHVAELTGCLVSRGFAVRVYCRPYYSSVSGEYHGVELVTLPTLYTKHLDAITHTLLATCHALFSGVDIIHYHAMGPSVLAILPKALGVRTVATVHGLDWKREKWGRRASAFLRFGEFASATFPDRTIVVSRALERHYAARYNRHVAYIPNGLTPRAPLEPRRIIPELGLRGRDYLLFVGRLVPEKGCHYLLEAFRDVKTDMRLVIAGGSSHSDEYVERLHALGRSDSRVIFTGYVHGDLLTELYSNAYLFVLPSDLEGLSLALLEALSMGNAVVASDIPENEEILLDSDMPPRGITFRRGDPRDLRDKLADLVGAPQEAASLRERGRAYVAQTYNWNRVADETAALYRSLLSSRRG
jgi:glycosyltransferase involved in cell wall biosynthesis